MLPVSSVSLLAACLPSALAYGYTVPPFPSAISHSNAACLSSFAALGKGTSRTTCFDAKRWKSSALIGAVQCGPRETKTSMLHRKGSTALFSSSPRNFVDRKDDGRAIGVLVLLTVPLAWGTYAPVVRYVYEMDPPVPGFVFSAGYYVVATLALVALNLLRHEDDETCSTSVNGAGPMNGSQVESKDNIGTSMPIQGGLELGGYLFLGNCLQVVGLKTVPADRAAFLVQLTTVMVPLLEAALERDLKKISRQTWAACALAFIGVVIMGKDGKELSEGDMSLSAVSSLLTTFSTGDLLIILAAFAYTLHVVRLGEYAQFTTPLRLAASKATTEAVLGILLVGLLFLLGESSIQSVPEFLNEMGTEVVRYFSTLGDVLSSGSLKSESLLPAVGAMLWTGLVTCAYTIFAQSFGQRRVGPTDANLIYTAQPVFSALFAWALLGETLGPAGFAGGSMIGAALALIAFSESPIVEDVPALGEEIDISRKVNSAEVKTEQAKSSEVDLYVK